MNNTIDKQAALDELIRRGRLPTGSTLTNMSESVLRPIEQQTESETQANITKLHGELPGTSPTPILGPAGVLMNRGQVRSQVSNEQERRAAYDVLIERGYDPEQLKVTLGVQKATKPPFQWGKTIGGMVGGYAAPLALSKLIPGPIDDVAIAAKLALKASKARRLLAVPLTAAAGAGAGGAVGETAQIGIQQKRIASLKEMYDAGKNEALWELGGRYAGPALKSTIFSPFIKKTNPEAARLMAKFGQNALMFSPQELDKRLVIRAAESISRGSFGTEHLWQEFAEKGLQGVRGVGDQLVDTIVEGAGRLPANEAVGVLEQGLRPGGFIQTQIDDLFDPLFKELKKMSPNARVSSAPLKAIAKAELAADAALMKGTKAGTHLTPKGRQLLETILDYKDVLGRDQMRTIRSDFLKEARTFAREADRGEALVKRLAGAADDAVFNPEYSVGTFKPVDTGEIKVFALGDIKSEKGLAYKGMTPEANRFLRNINGLYKATHEALETTFDERMIKTLAKDPAKYVQRLFPAKNPDAIIRLRESLTKPIAGKSSVEGKALWNQLRGNWYADVLDKATKEQGLSHSAYYNVLQNMGDSLKEMFPEKPIRDVMIRDIPSALGLKRITSAAGTPLFTKSMQTGGVITMYEGIKNDSPVAVTVGGALAIGPGVFAKFATEPTGKYLKYLTAGFNVKPGNTSQLIANTARIIKALKSIDDKEQQTSQQIEQRKKADRWQRSQPTLQSLRGFGGRGY